MATDSPLIHDGSMCTANANFYNPVSALAGPGGSGQFLAVVLSAARVLSIASVVTTPVYGILQNTPLATEACDVGIIGISKVVAGAGIAFGAELMVDSSGRVVTYSFVNTTYKVGLALEAAVLNQVFTMLIYNPSVRSPV